MNNKIEKIIIDEFENSKHAVVVEDDGVIGIVKTDYKSMARDVANKIIAKVMAGEIQCPRHFISLRCIDCLAENKESEHKENCQCFVTEDGCICIMCDGSKACDLKCKECFKGIFD